MELAYAKNVETHKDRGESTRGDICVIAVYRGKKSMKKLILTATGIKKDEIQALNKTMLKQWNEGLIVIPDDFRIQIIDEDWILVEKAKPPKGQLVLTWIEREENGEEIKTYGFGKWDGDGWIVYLQEASSVIAWATLTEPYISGDV